jgi:hypothetical protein
MEPTTPRLDLPTYRELLRDVPPPTAVQREAYPQWVANAHSWYKHIPPLGPGVPFLLYLDPGAGHDRVRRDDGGWKAAPRTEQGFHYTAIPTADYQRQFGHLAFANGEATQTGTLEDGSPRVETGFDTPVVDKHGVESLLPVEVEENAVSLTSIIHPSANQSFMWDMLASWDVADCPWPDASGGSETFEKIHARCCELRDDFSKYVAPPSSMRYELGTDAIFAELVAPERQRQRQLMLDAIERLLALVDLRWRH